jgi:ATP synthase protein I
VTGTGLRAALAVVLTAGAVAVLVAALTTGAAGAWGVLVGLGLLVGFYLFGLGTVQATSAVAPTISLLVALLTYTLQVVLLGLAFVVLQRSGLLDDAVDRRWLSGTVVTGTLLWTTSLVRSATRQRIPLYHTPADLAKPRNGASSERSDAG